MSNTGSSSGTASDSSLESGLSGELKIADANTVDWDGPNDPAKPRNWSPRKRWAHIIIVSILALVTNMAPTMCAPGISELALDFHITSPHVSTLAVTLYPLGLAIGPMLIAPLSEVYGRLPVYHIASLIFVAFLVGNALSKDVGQFMVFRFLSGCAGGTPMALGAGTIADVTTPQKRGIAMALFSLGPLTGPVLAPVIGGFTADHKGWRWTFWILAILGGTAGTASLLVMRETNPKIILRRKPAIRDPPYPNQRQPVHSHPVERPHRLLARALTRPTMILIRSPIVLVMSLYMALVFGTMYLLFTTFTQVFQSQYAFTKSTSGLAYLGLGAALVAAMVTSSALGDRVRTSRMRSDGVEQPRPEYRLVLMIWFTPLVGVGLLLYGWTVYYKVHWIVPIIGTAFIGFGAFFVIMPTQLYLVDLFGSKGAASALGATNLLRYLSSTFLPLAGPSMYKALGYGWGNTLLGFLAMAFIPAPILFYKYGEKLRAKTRVIL
ncbi:probable MFS multidrug transporter [Cephalotrichum gorgonifer]|uniref:Probable MFS multidrug transporter n=1 Tax=Cephalotrichum gorgonifer TaxID=2041049 RepID=A0AAE8N0M7_9PEZI|nr:probable MFS multidrug transporter [Cephalotrichum gorgonifer]